MRKWLKLGKCVGFGQSSTETGRARTQKSGQGVWGHKERK